MNGPVGTFTASSICAGEFEPKTPALLVVSNARAVLYRAELQAHIIRYEENKVVLIFILRKK